MKKLLVLAGLMIMLLTGCATAGKGETTTEPSSKTPNSVVGKWYVYDGYEMVSIWEFQKDIGHLSCFMQNKRTKKVSLLWTEFL